MYHWGILCMDDSKKNHLGKYVYQYHMKHKWQVEVEKEGKGRAT